jgi:hypothetical protein
MVQSIDETIVSPPPLDLPLPPSATPDNTPTILARVPVTKDVSENDDEIVELVELPSRVVDDSDEN